MKKCSICKVEKDESDFYLRTNKKLRSYCKKCSSSWGDVAKYCREKRKNDKLYSVSHRLRTRVGQIIKQKRFNKNNNLKNYLGCTLEEFIIYLESNFKDGMSWENKKEWHIDHIIPLSSAKTEEEMYKLCHYTNLQPLWAKDNIKKGNKIT